MRWPELLIAGAAEDDAYLALIGKNGRVRWLYRGPYSAEALDAMLAAIP